MSDTTIEWTDVTWNPTTGCDRISPGCAHCYAKAIHDRRHKAHLSGKPMPVQFHQPFEVVQTRWDRLHAPLRWRAPKKVFVDSMSDLFHEDVPEDFIAAVYAVMAWASQHTFQVLTKRAERMHRLLNDPAFREQVDHWVGLMLEDEDRPPALHFDPLDRRTDDARATAPDVLDDACWPLRNVWQLVSVENQPEADKRITLLLATPAAVRGVSAEPLLAEINIEKYLAATQEVPCCGEPGCEWCDGTGTAERRLLHWVIPGGESGPGARQSVIGWVRSLVRQCQAHGCAVFVKQLGANVIDRNDAGFEGDKTQGWPMDTAYLANINGCREDYQGAPVRVLLKKKGGAMAEWPEDLRVREFPEVANG